MRIGIDLGGTKIEGIALDDSGNELARKRVDTPRGSYQSTISKVAEMVFYLEKQTGRNGTVGIGIPGTISALTGLVKNANSTWLIGKPFEQDLEQALGRDVRIANDANCLAASESTDGAGAGEAMVFAVILGTGCGAGLAVNGKVHSGRHGIAGEWAHNSLSWLEPDEYPGPECYCGRSGCIETFVSGTGFEKDYERKTGTPKRGREIAALVEKGDPLGEHVMRRYESRLARGLAMLANVLDPDVFVLGGGMSNLSRLYQTLPELIPRWVFGGEFSTPIRPARHGDSSGVRGAAWLWHR